MSLFLVALYQSPFSDPPIQSSKTVPKRSSFCGHCVSVSGQEHKFFSTLVKSRSPTYWLPPRSLLTANPLEFAKSHRSLHIPWFCPVLAQDIPVLRPRYTPTSRGEWPVRSVAVLLFLDVDYSSLPPPAFFHFAPSF